MRPIGRTVVALALGLSTTVAISWTASLQQIKGLRIPDNSLRRRDPALAEGEGWLCAHHGYKFAWRETAAQATSPVVYASLTPTDRTPDQIISGRSRRLSMPWLDGLRPWPTDTIENFYLDEYGWPLRALYSRHFIAGRTNEWDHVWDLKSIGWFARRPPREIPGLPIGALWEGLFADTSVYTLAWAALLVGSPMLRRHLRHRRGRCPECGYDLHGTAAELPCPECGSFRRR